MKQTFNYKEKFAFSYCYPAIAFIILTVLSEVFQYGIRFKSLKLLAYPNSVYVLGVCALIFIVFALYKYSSARKSSKNPHPIEISETNLSFPKGSNEMVSLNFADINELRGENDEDEGKQLIICTQDKKRYQFSEDRFDNAGKYAEFESLVRQYANN